ncbi:PREDICTED: uncharacterized protein LOC105316712 [Amphimedon queenslandica]|uniref:PDZ domain-containing protein n=1 Tax=Amphimedon queenslandica TaxID=400682 RepID=A0A1X7VKP9_AMPQE|nr:PREDICTED: uncharacterized protein LOC105316712 [Amphimedon queenslandica]|eukprot:XP_019848684.1 PREDICTED: uncharacterized protein LOC105316712 [Amphimedon queenslandica]
MIARHHLSSKFSVDLNHHHSSLVHMLKSTCSLLKRAVKESKNIAGPLAFWLSNTSELLHFLRRDYQLYMYAQEYENMLTSIIHMAYKHFTECMIREISLYLPAFLSDSVDSEEVSPPSQSKPEREVSSQEPDVVAISHASSHPSLYWLKGGAKTSRIITIKSLLSTLSGTLSLLHLCKVNRTLSILIFNLLFRYISMRLFNKLVTEPRYCTRSIGSLLLSRLDRLKAWARTESLNLPADEHLAVIYQAAKLLSHDLKNVHVDHLNVHSLNSCQVKALLYNIEENEGKESLSSLLVDKLLTNAYNEVDQKLLADGQDVYLQEDPNLELPFLIPEHGYSCDTMRGVPVGLEEYLETAIVSGLCQLTVTKDSLGCWIPPRVTTSKQRESPLSTQASTQMSQTLPRNFPYSPYTSEQKACRPKSSMDIPDGNESSIISVTLSASNNKSLGINLSVFKDSRGISEYFIKSLLRDGSASEDGRLQPGDRILQINNTPITGLGSEVVEKLLHSSHGEATIVVSTSGHSLSDSQPQIPTKLPPQSQNEIFPPPKEGSSHAMKAARRELRRQQQTPSRQSYDYHHQQQLYSPVVPQLPTHMTKWLQEQREISQQRPSGYHRSSMPHGVSQSMSSLIHVPEQDEPPVSHYRVTTPSGSDVSDNQSVPVRGLYGKMTTPTSSKQLLPGQQQQYQSRSRSEFMSGFNDGSYTDDLSNTSHSQTPFKELLSNSLSGQTSDVDTSQSYPSLAREKLSMEVGYHTQLSSTGLSVSSVLDHLPKKGKKAGIGLQLQGLEVDEIELEKQRMQLLFYRQQKERKDQLDPSSAPVDDSQQSASDAWPAGNEQQYEGKGQGDEEDLLVEPEKLLQVAKIKQDLEYVKKMINEQRKRCRELQFAKERGEQSLNQAEARFKSQSRHFVPYMRHEDEMRWQRDQKRKLKEWERFSAEKKNELHHIEVKEIEAKTRLRALEQHASDLKKQLATCEISSRDIPERDWGDRSNNNTRPIRVTSTESITTGSSWVSSENIPRDTTSIGSDIPEFQFGPIIRGSSLDCHSDSSSPKPFQPQWHPRHPELHGSCESPTLMHNSDVAFNTKIPKARVSSEQEERVRLLIEEHTHHLSSLENIPSRSAKDKDIQVHHLKQEVRRLQDTPVYIGGGGGMGGYDSRESSLSSSTPDVVPVMYAPPLTARLLSNDTKSDHHRPSSSSSVPNYSRPSFQQSLLKSRSRDELSRDIPEKQHRHIEQQHSGGLLGGGDLQQRYQYPEQDSRSNRKVPKSGGPHSYSRGRPEPPSSDDRSNRVRLSGTPQLTTRYVQRQQTDL